MRSSEGNSTSIEPVNLGQVSDLEDDVITQRFNCITCGDDADIRYNEVDGVVTIPGDTPAGSYLIELVVSDNNADSQREKYTFKISVQEPIVVDPLTTE